jgi:glutaminase
MSLSTRRSFTRGTLREDCDPLEAVDLYTRQGSLNVSAKDLAFMGAPWLRADSIPSLESRSSAPMSVIMFWP